MAATKILMGEKFISFQQLHLPDQAESLSVRVSSAALIEEGRQAIAISFCDPGLGLDLTKGLEIWTRVQLQEQTVEFDSYEQSEPDLWLQIVAGFGVGKLASSNQLCISKFARELIAFNLRPLVPSNYSLKLEIVFPEGKDLAERTSNKAFGVVDGLAIIGTQLDVKDSASPQQLKNTLQQLRSKSSEINLAEVLVLVIGENGWDLALQLGIPKTYLLKTGNWLGPLLVAAAEEGVSELLVFGYHGKLVKLAGGIFHTHHHLADARLEILTSLAVREELPFDLIKSIGASLSVEAAVLALEAYDQALAQKLLFRVASEVEQRSLFYLSRHGQWPMKIGAALFDRRRQLRWAGPLGIQQLDSFGLTLAA